MLAVFDYLQALEPSHEATGRGLGRRAWNTLPKTGDIDTLLCGNRALQVVLRELNAGSRVVALAGDVAEQNTAGAGGCSDADRPWPHALPALHW